MIHFQEANNAKNKTKIILFILGVLFFSYSCVRAYLLGITYDEAFVYIEFVRNHTFFSPRADGLNVQLLNNYLMILSTKYFGNSEFALRLPNVLAHALFLFYSAKLILRLNGKVFIVSAFLIVNLNPYMLDFFSLARQYGLSMTFMMASVYFLYKHSVEENKSKDAVFTMLFASLTVFASVVMLNYFLSLFGILVLTNMYFSFQKERSFSEGIKTFSKGIIIPSFIFFSVLLFIVPQAQSLKDANQMFFGQNNGFFHDTLLSAVFGTEYSQPIQSRFLVLLPAYFVVFLLVCVGLFLILKWRIKKRNNALVFLGSIYSILLLCSLSTIIQFHLFSTNFLFWRTTLFLIVLFNLIFVFFINELSLQWKKTRYISYFISILLIVHFLTSFRWTRVLEWKENEEIKTMMMDLQEMKQRGVKRHPIFVEASSLLQPCINYYRDKNNLTWLNQINSKRTESALNDYYLVSTDEFSHMHKDSFLLIKSYLHSGFILARPTYLLNKEKLVFSDSISFSKLETGFFHQSESEEFSKCFERKLIDSAASFTPAVITFSANLLAKNVQDAGLEMVITLERETQLILWESGFVNDFINEVDTNTEAFFSCICDIQIEAGDVLKAYIWNPNHHDIFIREMSLKWTKRSFK